VLAVLGAAHVHQRNFPLFLGSVLALAVLAVAVFVFTAAPASEADPDRR
jgi:hypothetical protein